MSLIRLGLPIAAVAFAAAVLPATAAGAQPYPPPEPTLTVSVGTVVVGASVEVTGTGFGFNELVSLSVSYQALGMASDSSRGSRAVSVSFALPGMAEQTIVTDGKGIFRTDVTLDRVGHATITAVGRESGRSGSATVVVVSSSGALPSTGTDGGTYLRIALAGAGAVLVGGFLTALTVRRRRVGTGTNTERVH
jgi:hypothetical protein